MLTHKSSMQFTTYFFAKLALIAVHGVAVLSTPSALEARQVIVGSNCADVVCIIPGTSCAQVVPVSSPGALAVSTFDHFRRHRTLLTWHDMKVWIA